MEFKLFLMYIYIYIYLYTKRLKIPVQIFSEVMLFKTNFKGMTFAVTIAGDSE